MEPETITFGVTPQHLALGIDLIEVDRIAATLERFGDRFLARVFTPAELAITGRDPARLAGRFAAKEACSKALGTGIGSPGWREIECLRDAQGKPWLRLHGAAADLARAFGWAEVALTITTTRHQALACVVAIGHRQG